MYIVQYEFWLSIDSEYGARGIAAFTSGSSSSKWLNLRRTGGMGAGEGYIC